MKYLFRQCKRDAGWKNAGRFYSQEDSALKWFSVQNRMSGMRNLNEVEVDVANADSQQLWWMRETLQKGD